MTGIAYQSHKEKASTEGRDLSIRRIREIGNRGGNKKQKKKGKSQLFFMCEMMETERERERVERRW